MVGNKARALLVGDLNGDEIWDLAIEGDSEEIADLDVDAAALVGEQLKNERQRDEYQQARGLERYFLAREQDQRCRGQHE